MAKRRRSSTATRTRIVRVGAPRTAAPIIKVSAPRAAPVRRRRSHRRRRSSVGGIGSMGGLVGNVLGGAIFGFAVKQGWVDKLPAIPLIGRTGAAAIALDYYSKHGGGEWARRTAMAAGVLAGYQLGNDGAVHGFDASPDYSQYDAEDSYAD